MLRVIISGGQTGVDIAALQAAKKAGLQTEGWMPKGFRTLEGTRPEYAQLFGLREHFSSEYGPRTDSNVRDSHGTLRIAQNFHSPGERRTKKALSLFQRPYLDLDWSPSLGFDVGARERAHEFIDKHRIERLNVAGNSEKTAKGIQDAAVVFLYLLFRECV